RSPTFTVVAEATLTHEHVQMAIEVKVAPKRVGDNDYKAPDGAFSVSALLQDSGAQNRKIMEEMPIPAKQRPENVRHRQAHMRVRDLWKLAPPVPLPRESCLVTAAGARARFACVVDDAFFVGGSEHFSASGGSPARHHFPKRFTYVRASGVDIPHIAG